MRKGLVCVCLLLLCSCAAELTQEKDWRDKYLQTSPEKMASYQIQEQEATIGYAHKYEWYTEKGNLYHHYLVYDLHGSMIGYIESDGRTEKYLPNGRTEVLGNYSFEIAAGLVLGNPRPLRIFPVRATDVPMPKVQEVTIVKQPAKSKQTTPGASKSKETPPTNTTGTEPSETTATTQPEAWPEKKEEQVEEGKE